MTLRLLSIPHYQCTECLGMYQGVVSDDKQFVTFTHDSSETYKECSKVNKNITVSISDFSETLA